MDGDAIDTVVDEALEELRREAERERARRDHAIAARVPGDRYISGIQELKE